VDTEIYYETAKLDKQNFTKYAYGSENIQGCCNFSAEEKKRLTKGEHQNLKEKQQRAQIDLDDLITEVKSMLW